MKNNIKKGILSGVIISALIFSMIIPTNAGNHQTTVSMQPNNDICDCNNIKVLDGGYVVLSSFPPLTKEDLMTSIPYPQPTRSFGDVPSYFNWKDNGGDWSTPAKNQGNCGSCWGFSAIGAMDAAINIASHNPDTDIDLSEQYVLSCLSSAGSCDGGWMHLAIDAIYSTSQGSAGNGINGCTIESCMPYQAVDYIPCSDKCDDWNYIDLSPDGKLWQIQDWGWTNSFEEDNEDDWNTIKTWIMDYGPLSIDLYASSGFCSYWNGHHSKNDVYENDDSGWTNHGVVLLGWKDDPSIANGGYWICKNSWGTGFGYEGGFFNIAYGCNGVATRDCTWVTTPEWEGGESGQQYVSSSFSFSSLYPKPGETVYFRDESSGPVVLWEWDFDSDNIVDSNKHNPSYIFPDVGRHPVRLTVWNEKGLNSTCIRTVTVKTAWPPIVIAKPEYYGCNNPRVSFDGTLSWDIDGYITRYEWDMDDGTTVYGAKPTYTFPEGDRIYNVTLTVTDNEGATGTAMCDIRIDTTMPPITTLSIGYGGVGQRCFKSPVLVGLIADDWTGVRNSYYRINADEMHQDFVTYSGLFRLWNEGIYNIDFYSVDVYGNREETKSDQIVLDFTLPVLNDSEFSGKLENGWYKTPIIISLSGYDPGDEPSGLDKILYIIDGGGLPLPWWNEYNGSFIFAENGIHTLEVCAVDKAGNIVMADLVQIKIDVKEHPLVNIVKPDFGIYINNEKIFPFIAISVVLGDVDVVAEIGLPYEGMQVEYVEFYIDGVLCYTDTSMPAEWLWSGGSFGSHTILVKAAVNGYTDIFTDETTVFRLF